MWLMENNRPPAADQNREFSGRSIKPEHSASERDCTASGFIFFSCIPFYTFSNLAKLKWQGDAWSQKLIWSASMPLSVSSQLYKQPHSSDSPDFRSYTSIALSSDSAIGPHTTLIELIWCTSWFDHISLKWNHDSYPSHCPSPSRLTWRESLQP